MRANLILASTSPYRRALLERLGVAFQVEAPGVAEHHLAEEPPPQRAIRLAREKAAAVARAHPGAVVIGSDQVCALDGRILDKPGTEARARRQLRQASGLVVDFYTALSVTWGAGSETAGHLDHTRVGFRKLSDAQVNDYVARERPLDCAGSFKCEGLGIALFEYITSDDPTALIGLPLIAVTRLLAQAGLPVLAGR